MGAVFKDLTDKRFLPASAACCLSFQIPAFDSDDFRSSPFLSVYDASHCLPHSEKLFWYLYSLYHNLW